MFANRTLIVPCTRDYTPFTCIYSCTRFLLERVLSSSCCMGYARLSYWGLPLAFHIY